MTRVDKGLRDRTALSFEQDKYNYRHSESLDLLQLFADCSSHQRRIQHWVLLDLSLHNIRLTSVLLQPRCRHRRLEAAGIQIGPSAGNSHDFGPGLMMNQRKRTTPPDLSWLSPLERNRPKKATIQARFGVTVRVLTQFSILICLRGLVEAVLTLSIGEIVTMYRCDVTVAWFTMGRVMSCDLSNDPWSHVLIHYPSKCMTWPHLQHN
jgi:hypothetical protein